MGSRAMYASLNMKRIPQIAAIARMIQTKGFVQETFCPPRSRTRRKPTIVKARDVAPRKSMRRSFPIWLPRLSDSKEAKGAGDLSFHVTKRIANKDSGHCM